MLKGDHALLLDFGGDLGEGIGQFSPMGGDRVLEGGELFPPLLLLGG